jgi:phosphohistidine phosphatase
MKQLIIMRHGEAETGAGMPDFDRALTEKGRADARDIGNRLQTAGCVPDAVFASPALRARTTAELAVEGAGLPPGCLTLDDRIYQALPDTLLEIAAFAEPVLGRIMLVGHNPTFHMFAHGFIGGDAVVSMKPGTAVIVDVSGDWAALTPRSGKVREVLSP